MLSDEVAKIIFGGVVGGDARGDDEASAALRVEDGAVVLREDGVGVDVALGAQGIAARLTQEEALPLSFATGKLP